MATTFTLISTVTVGSGGSSSIDFTSIPATYTDLLIVASLRTNYASTFDNCDLRFNNNASSGGKRLYGSGTAAASDAYGYMFITNGATSTASTFSNSVAYIPNYSSSNYKSYSIDTVVETNAAGSYSYLESGLFSSASPVNQLTLLSTTSSTIAQYSTASLYGITKVAGTQYTPSTIPGTLSIGDTIIASYTGASQTISLPAGVNTLGISCYGGVGGGYTGSGSANEYYAGFAYGEYTVGGSALTMYAYVGGKGTGYNSSGTGSGTNAGGFNGGGNGSYAGNTSTGGYGSAGGGGATDIRIGGTALANRIIVAGGSGGRGAAGYGGAGGWSSGDQGTPTTVGSFNGQAGFGGTQTAGGAAGGGRSGSEDGVAGSLGTGGTGGNLNGTYGVGAGGGGGYYGGGGGGGHSNGSGGGGGGGSSYVGSLSNTIKSNNAWASNGVVYLTVLS